MVQIELRNSTTFFYEFLHFATTRIVQQSDNLSELKKALKYMLLTDHEVCLCIRQRDIYTVQISPMDIYAG